MKNHKNDANIDRIEDDLDFLLEMAEEIEMEIDALIAEESEKDKPS